MQLKLISTKSFFLISASRFELSIFIGLHTGINTYVIEGFRRGRNVA
jgi:hypothetical protein